MYDVDVEVIWPGSIRSALCYVTRTIYLQSKVIPEIREKVVRHRKQHQRVHNPHYTWEVYTFSDFMEVLTLVFTNWWFYSDVYSARKGSTRSQTVPFNCTNNQCEAMNHIVKDDTNWKPEKTTDLVESIQRIVKLHYADIRVHSNQCIHANVIFPRTNINHITPLNHTISSVPLLLT